MVYKVTSDSFWGFHDFISFCIVLFWEINVLDNGLYAASIGAVFCLVLFRFFFFDTFHGIFSVN